MDAFIKATRSFFPSKMKGKTVMWWITVNIFAMCWYVTCNYKDGVRLDGSIAAIYGLALAAFAGEKIANTVTERRSVDRNDTTEAEEPAGTFRP